MPIGSILQGAAAVNNSMWNTAFGLWDRIDQEHMIYQNQENWDKVFNYQKKLNDILMQREDNSVQRKAADLAAAGINPILAGLGGASAQMGQVITPLQQSAPQWREGMGQIDLSGVGEAINKLKEIKSTEKLKDEEITAEFELQKRQIEASSMSEDKKYEAEKSLELTKELYDYKKFRENANDVAEQGKLDRELQWKIHTYKALRTMFENSEVPLLNTIWTQIIDNTDLFNEDGTLNFNKFKEAWDSIFKKDQSTEKIKPPKSGRDEKGRFHYEWIKGTWRKIYDN